MGTLGLVTVRKDGEVIMKVAAGQDGNKAPALAAFIRANWPLTIDQVHAEALRLPFGNTRTLVTITRGEYRYNKWTHGREYFITGCPLYDSTFDDPEFNPRWEQGISDYTEIVDV